MNQKSKCPNLWSKIYVYNSWKSFCSVVTKNYQHVLALEFAIKKINENPFILPNVTLGFHMYDIYSDARLTYQATMQLISTKNKFIPNYECGHKDKLSAIIGGLRSDTSHLISNILGIYKTPQVGGMYRMWK